MTLSGAIRETMLPYGKQYIDEDDIEAVIQVLRSDFLTQGPVLEKFEQEVASYVGAKYAVAFSNGTAALHGACFAAGIGEGDEVITSPITFVASSNCVLYMGGKPVFADIKHDTYNIDPDQIEQKITKLTKAIVAVDFTGQPAEMDRIQAIAKKHNLIVIEDAAHSLGASFQDKRVGVLADMTMFSFHPVKHITTGEGGIIVTDNEQFYNQLKLFRSHGITREPALMSQIDGPWYYQMIDLGYNYRMTDIQAALGTSQLNKLDTFVARRREIVSQYIKAFSNLTGLITPYQHPSANSSWHLFVLRWEKEHFKGNQVEIFNALREEKLGVNLHYIPVYKQPYYQQLGYKDNLCKEAEKYYETAVTLPLFPAMSEQDVNFVINGVKNIYWRYKL